MVPKTQNYNSEKRINIQPTLLRFKVLIPSSQGSTKQKLLAYLLKFRPLLYVICFDFRDSSPILRGWQMFSQLFDSCLENISIIRPKRDIATKPVAEHLADAQLITTLGEVVRSSSYVLFYIMSSATPPNPLFVQALHKFICTKNRQTAAEEKNLLKNG